MGSGLKIHTKMEPAPAVQEDRKGDGGPKKRRISWERPVFAGFGDRLLRSTAVACALLLSIMALRNADLPWTQRAVQGIEKAMTMRIDLDNSLGRLRFVRELVPETALVFWNAGSQSVLQAPVEGQIEHMWTQRQPWRVYACADGATVSAALDGEVARVEKGAMADYIVLITHDNGLETVYAYLADVSVSPGERVYAGDPVGVTAAGGGSRLYFALRQEGAEIDPGDWER
ncbi:MAG: M23 family metallopeptidase [Clostridia bacterium]|nr:M23 family metallopeptidase [Clostridia bacterium]